jgi:hypothetical protein
MDGLGSRGSTATRQLRSALGLLIQFGQDVILHITTGRHDNRKPAKIGPLGRFSTLVSKPSRLSLISIWGRLDAFADPVFQKCLWIGHGASPSKT